MSSDQGLPFDEMSNQILQVQVDQARSVRLLRACTLGTPVFTVRWIKGNYPAYIDPDVGDSYFLLASYILAMMLVLMVASLVGVYLSVVLIRPFFKREDVEWFYSRPKIAYITPVTHGIFKLVYGNGSE